MSSGSQPAFDPAWVRENPNPLAEHYREFRVAQRLLLTGHSHQAWPDRARRGLDRSWTDAAELVDSKWERAFAATERVQEGYRRLLGGPEGPITLSQSTHDLLVRLFSALDWKERPRAVTTDREFYSARRQLLRMAEEGIEVDWIPAEPVDEVGERLAEAVDDRTAVCLVSTVFFSTGEIAGDLRPTLAACRQHGAILVLDVYHHLNVLPLDLQDAGLDEAYVVGGGYKYCQLGEGNAFLRTPPDCALRPVATGWFAAFDSRSRMPEGEVPYGPGYHRFMGGTFDPVSHYRGAAVFDFFRDLEMAPEKLRKASQWQVGRLRERFDLLDLPPDRIRRPDVPLERQGGFLALEAPRAAEIRAELLERGVYTDSRRTTLRLGPAPYLSRSQLDDAVEALAEVVGR
ncbi:MAG: aminotransferase class V-fold PLP-dependent enzyme [Thermoanaerobaculia bacterium]|nr:aminotransferase class V-fold PLP-dependent enzyme [Thermoanaerobaculia bacterium]